MVDAISSATISASFKPISVVTNPRVLLIPHRYQIYSCYKILLNRFVTQFVPSKCFLSFQQINYPYHS